MVRTRKTPDARREEILRACADLVDQRGADVVRFSDVADSLGISPSLIAYHFRSKDALIAETFSWAAQRDLRRLADVTSGGAPARDRLMAALGWYSPTGAAYGWRLWIEHWAMSLRSPTLRKVGRDLDGAWKQALVAIIEQGCASEEFVCADAREAATRITAFLDGLAVQAIVYRRRIPARLAAERTRDVVARELGMDPEELADR